MTYVLAVSRQILEPLNRSDWHNRNEIRSSSADGPLSYSPVPSTLLIEIDPVKLVRRYWGAGLILLMVAIHAGVIGYVRSRVARLSRMQSTAVEIGSFRFQPVDDLSKVYHFNLHAVVDPSKMRRGEERLNQMRMEILEASEQLLRQVDPAWLDDPAQVQIRERLMNIVLENLDETSLVQRVLITDWLELPVQNIDLELSKSTPTLASR